LQAADRFTTSLPASPHRICLSQLAFFTSHPRLAPVLVAGPEKLNGEAGEDNGASPGTKTAPRTLGDWLGSLDAQRNPDLGKAFKLLPSLEALPLDEFCRWLPMTSCYLFHRAD
jgi:hypothetical protein